MQGLERSVRKSRVILKYSYLQNFRSLDSQTFESLMRHLGFVAAACYRRNGDALVQVLCTGAGDVWPAAVELSIDYTSPGRGMAPLGWTAPSKIEKMPKGWRNIWPKNISLYFPEQELYAEQFVFAVINSPGKRSRGGELNGPLEAITGRLRSWYLDQAGRQELSETGLKEHIRTLGVDLSRIIDHELRTPLASVAGYASLLKDVDPHTQRDVWQEYWQVLEAELGNTLEAVDKLSLALHSEAGVHEGEESGAFDAAEVVRQLCEEARERAVDIAGEDAAKRLLVRYLKSSDQPCDLNGSKRLFCSAVWEVLRNALSHSRSGRVDVAVYTSGSNLVIDVSDDGVGVSAGSEELIFLRFYQDPGAQQERRGKRGLGLGLFLARHIAEQHMGQLTLVRQRGATMFRFVWPRVVEQTLPKGA